MVCGHCYGEFCSVGSCIVNQQWVQLNTDGSVVLEGFVARHRHAPLLFSRSRSTSHLSTSIAHVPVRFDLWVMLFNNISCWEARHAFKPLELISCWSCCWRWHTYNHIHNYIHTYIHACNLHTYIQYIPTYLCHEFVVKVTYDIHQTDSSSHAFVFYNKKKKNPCIMIYLANEWVDYTRHFQCVRSSICQEAQIIILTPQQLLLYPLFGNPRSSCNLASSPKEQWV